MSSYTPSPAFPTAASYLSNAPALSQVSNTVKLELYGLFKLITVSPSPNTSRPSFFDMTGRAKWDAWAQASQDYDGRLNDAEKRYLDIASSLGWKETESGESEGVPSAEQESRASESSRPGGGGAGMGVSVSIIAPPALDKNEEGTVHGFAVQNDAQALSEFLEHNSNADLNAKDEFGYTPLHLACDRGNLPIVELLLAKGVDTSIKDPDDFEAVELARIAGHDDIVATLERGS